MLRAGRSGIRIPAGATDFFLFSKTSDRLLGPPSLPVNRRRGSGRMLMLTTNLHLSPRLRMSGVIPPLSLYTFIAWIRTYFKFYILCLSCYSNAVLRIENLKSVLLIQLINVSVRTICILTCLNLRIFSSCHVKNCTEFI
jgi:hypothetical protein